ncbi:hypothetical protein C0Q70_21571 [Pomacea canaliculata]|uniref:Uncharacterized protein n=1 Tax=Pomacea canaliculata TaxID=400727 RepID=A0A2T7ND01_POMCA|nr:hypothetical protein C0Q70_21571 [Pomacea canaliculata]
MEDRKRREEWRRTETAGGAEADPGQRPSQNENYVNMHQIKQACSAGSDPDTTRRRFMEFEFLVDEVHK